VIDDNVDVTVVVDISKSRAPPTCVVAKYGPASRVARRKRFPFRLRNSSGGSAYS